MGDTKWFKGTICWFFMGLLLSLLLFVVTVNIDHPYNNSVANNSWSSNVADMLMLFVDIVLTLILFWFAQSWPVTFIVCLELSTLLPQENHPCLSCQVPPQICKLSQSFFLGNLSPLLHWFSKTTTLPFFPLLKLNHKNIKITKLFILNTILSLHPTWNVTSSFQATSTKKLRPCQVLLFFENLAVSSTQGGGCTVWLWGYRNRGIGVWLYCTA